MLNCFTFGPRNSGADSNCVECPETRRKKERKKERRAYQQKVFHDSILDFTKTIIGNVANTARLNTSSTDICKQYISSRRLHRDGRVSETELDT